MLKTFPIEFIRQAIEQKLLQEHMLNPNFFGGKNQVNILSFYEQLKSQDEVDRFVETYRDLTEQQNRSGLILNGVLLAPENPTITNLYSSLNIPMTWTCSLRCMLENRDQAIVTINNMIEKLKGRKVDIAQLNCVDQNGKPCSKPFVVGTIGQGMGKIVPQDGDYYGALGYAGAVGTEMLNDFELNDIITSNAKYFYGSNGGVIKVVKKYKGEQISIGEQTYIGKEIDSRDYITSVTIKFTSASMMFGDFPIPYPITQGYVDFLMDNEQTRHVLCDAKIIKYEVNSDDYLEITVDFEPKESVDDDRLDEIGDAYCDFYQQDFEYLTEPDEDLNIPIPPEHTSFEKYKMSLSFDAIKCDEPHNLNGKEYCELSFGGSATLVSDGVKLGNDLLKISVSKKKIQGSSDLASNITYLEPLEMPSGNNANTKINQLVSNKFLTNSHTDASNITLQYTFLIDENVPLLEQLFNYARYGKRGISVNDISQNMIFTIKEYWCSWGKLKQEEYLAKIVENIDIDNTESDTMTISVTFQVQGEHN